MPVISDDIYLAIRNKLADGELAVGERVSEQTLANEFGVSRTPVREAIKRLQNDGYLDQVDRIGTIARKPDITEIAEAYELREALESFTMANMTPESYAHIDADLADNCEQMHELAPRFVDCKDPGPLSKKMFALDGEFHGLILPSSNNQRIVDLVAGARLFTHIYSVRRHSILSFETVMEIYRDHVEVLEWARRGDFKEAADSIAHHIRSGKAGALDWLRLQHRLEFPGDNKLTRRPRRG